MSLKVAFVVGEESGDAIAADLARALRRRLGGEVALTGLGGTDLAAEGLESLFDIEELSIIGVSAIVARLPQLLRRLDQTVARILAEEPDILVLVDSPTFSHRVGKRIRRRRPALPIVNYVPPTVWAWRSGRAAAMRAYVDHALCILPFEPAVMERLGGPPATYVGHPLMANPALEGINGADPGLDREPASPPTCLVLPGSRRGEIDRLAPPFGATLAKLADRIPGVRTVLPGFERHRAKLEGIVADWPVRPELVTGAAAKWDAFSRADAALAASGTVSLELALAGVPMALAYKLDPVAYRVRHLITTWTAAMPNFVVDHPLVPEHFHEFVRADHLARRMERLLTDTPERSAQRAGFLEVRRRMAVDRPPGEAAADVVMARLARA